MPFARFFFQGIYTSHAIEFAEKTSKGPTSRVAQIREMHDQNKICMQKDGNKVNKAKRKLVPYNRIGKHRYANVWYRLGTLLEVVVYRCCTLPKDSSCIPNSGKAN